MEFVLANALIVDCSFVLKANSGFGFCPHKVHLKMQCFSLIMSIYSYQYSKCFFHALQLKTVFESCEGIYDCEGTTAGIALMVVARGKAAMITKTGETVNLTLVFV